MESKTWWSIVLVVSCYLPIRKRNPTGSIKNGICWIIVIVSTIFSLLQELFPPQKNTSVFHLKRLYVLGKTHLCLKENVLAFCDERKDVFYACFRALKSVVFRLPVHR